MLCDVWLSHDAAGRAVTSVSRKAFAILHKMAVTNIGVSSCMPAHPNMACTHVVSYALKLVQSWRKKTTVHWLAVSAQAYDFEPAAFMFLVLTSVFRFVLLLVC